MRITRETFSLSSDLTTEMIEVIFIKSTLKKRACVNSGSGMALEIHVVTCSAVVFAVEEMVETNFVQACGTRKR